LADYVNVDFVRIPPELRRKISNELRDKTTVMLAKGINTHADFTARRAKRDSRCLRATTSASLVAMRNRRPPVNQMLRLDILKALQQHPHGHAQGEPTGEARRPTHVSTAASGELAGLGDAPECGIDRGGAGGGRRECLSPTGQVFQISAQ
jgi:hypothetical protein